MVYRNPLYRKNLQLSIIPNSRYFIIEIKSGPNWGNSSQIKKMKDNFANAKQTLQRQNPDLNVIAVNGCCYGTDSKPNKGEYLKICGQDFWRLISGNDALYTDIIEPIGHKAREKNEEFLKAYAKVVNQFTLKFAQEFCENGEIQWQKIVEFTSKSKNLTSEKPRRLKKRRVHTPQS